MYHAGLLPKDCQWAALGMARGEMRIAARSVLLGGSLRVGREDNSHLSRGVSATNGAQVERGRTIIEYLGEEVATQEETREMLELKSYGRGGRSA